MSNIELAVNYSSLILHDDKQDITVDKLVNLSKAAGINVPAHIAQLYVQTLAKKKIDSLLTVSSSAPVAAATPVAATTTVAKKAEPKKEEKKEESDEDMGMSLFD